jgi:hypothetical protein
VNVKPIPVHPGAENPLVAFTTFMEEKCYSFIPGHHTRKPKMHSKYIHTYHSLSQIFLRDTHVLPKS